MEECPNCGSKLSEPYDLKVIRNRLEKLDQKLENVFTRHMQILGAVKDIKEIAEALRKIAE